MPVPSVITDLSATAASNSPSGSEAPSVLDDHQRTLGAFIRQLYDLVASASGSLTSSAFSTGNFTYTGTLTGGTGVVNLGSGQFYKDASGNVGIGTGSPARKLEVSGASTYLRVSGTAGTLAALELSSGGVVNWSLRSNNSSGGDFALYQDATERWRTDSSGNFGIGTTSPAAKLHVNGSVRLDAATTTSATAGANGDVPAQVVGYLTVNINGTDRKIPYYA